jgi:hypothetical protein
MTTHPVDTELRALLRLALEHSRRDSSTPWIGVQYDNLRVNLSIRRTFAPQIHVFVVARAGRPNLAQLTHIIRTLGLRPYKQETIPLFGTDAAFYLVSQHYDLRDPNPRPSPV